MERLIPTLDPPLFESFRIDRECETLPAIHSVATARLEAAVKSRQPAQALIALARELKAQGMSRNNMYQLFFTCFFHHQEHADDQLINAIASTLDIIRQRFGEL